MRCHIQDAFFFVGSGLQRALAGEAAEDSLWNRFQAGLRGTLGPPLKALQAPVDDWLGRLPMSLAVASAVGLYVLALLWVWRLPRTFVFRGAPDQKEWRDLRIWATLVILPCIVVYVWLGR